MARKETVSAARSAQMKLIKARDTKPERIVRRALHMAGLRYRLHARELPGKPDIVFASRRTVVFVHGCFWHQHPDPNCKLARMPKSRREFWEPKLTGNRVRDRDIAQRLEQKGWQVIEVWECQLNESFLTSLVKTIYSIEKAND